MEHNLMNSRKIAVVTGGSSGLGSALIDALKNDYFVVNISRSAATNADANIAADLTVEAGRLSAVNEIKNKFGRIDLLVNNAGIGAYGTFEELSMEEIRRLFEIDLFAPIEMTRILMPELQKTSGAVINIASMAAKIHVPAMGGYCAVKSAFAMFSETLRVEAGVKGVRVITVYPGRVNTGFSSRAIKYREVPNTPDNSGVSPQDFAASVIKTLKNPRRKRLFFPWWYRPGAWLVKLLLEEYYNRKNIQYWKLNDK